MRVRLEPDNKALLVIAERLIAGGLDELHAKLNASIELSNAITNDFHAALSDADQSGMVPHHRRNIVRCFGALIDGYAASMRSAAVELCRLFDRPLNVFLQQKAADRSLSTQYRLESLYRLIAGFLPQSPFAHVPDKRWRDLHTALEVRNRVVHPEKLSHLDLTNGQVSLICELALAFDSDFRKFVHWFSQLEQKLLWQLPVQRKRFARKLQRNDLCVCCSGKKAKKCCGVAEQSLAAA